MRVERAPTGLTLFGARDVADCLASGSAPEANPDCAFFEYVARAPAAGG